MNEFPDIEIKQDEPLMNYTYTKTGGPADWLAFPETVDQVYPHSPAVKIQVGTELISRESVRDCRLSAATK